MTTYLVWILVIYTGSYEASGVTIVDNIASKAHCEQLARAAVPKGINATYRCVAATKLKP